MLRVVKKPGMLKNISHVGRRGGSNLSSAWLGLVTNKAKSLVKARLDTFRLERGSDRKKLEKIRLELGSGSMVMSSKALQAFFKLLKELTAWPGEPGLLLAPNRCLPKRLGARYFLSLLGTRSF